MLLRIDHRIAWELEEPARFSIHYVRLWPTNEPTQAVVDWRVESRGRTAPFTDGYGNKLLSLSLTEPHRRLALHAGGVVETRDAAGIYGFALDPLPPAYWLRNEGLARHDGGIAGFAAAIKAKGGAELLDLAHQLMTAIHAGIRRERAQGPGRATAAEVLAAGAGGPEDLAHLFIAAARAVGIPARFATGYLFRPDIAIDGMHCWAEAWFEHLGWVGFDPAHSISPTEHYVRVAVGRDHGEAAPVAGLPTEAVKVEVTVAAI